MATPKKKSRPTPPKKKSRTPKKAPKLTLKTMSASDLAALQRISKAHPAFTDGGHSHAELRKAVTLASKTPSTIENILAGRIALALLTIDNAEVEAGLEPEDDDDDDNDDEEDGDE